MIGVVYLGNNPKTQERLKYIPGQLVRMTNAYKEAAQICTPHVSNEHFLVFYERSVRNEDITAITYLRKKSRNVYIVLVTDAMTEEERGIYIKCGINDTIHQEASVTELNKKIQFISDRENVLFSEKAPIHGILKFKSGIEIAQCPICCEHLIEEGHSQEEIDSLGLADIPDEWTKCGICGTSFE